MNTKNRNLKLTGIFLNAFLLTAFALAPTAHGQAGQIECESRVKNIKVVTVEATQAADAVFNFPNDGVGHFSSTPLLSTTIQLGGRQRGCLVARFSAQALPLDNAMVFQARVDGVPMKGHHGILAIPTPVVYDSEETNLNLGRMVSHDFFAVIEPGTHMVEILFAGCCSAAPGGGPFGYVGGAVLTLEF